MLDQTHQQLRKLFVAQRFAVLATSHRDQPYLNVVSFVASDDLRTLLFATDRATRKYANLRDNPQIAMLIDSRANQPSDVTEAMAVTAVGSVAEVPAAERAACLPGYLAKHPQLADFVNAPTCALLRLRVTCYYVVTQFQHVVEVRMA